MSDYPKQETKGIILAASSDLVTALQEVQVDPLTELKKAADAEPQMITQDPLIELQNSVEDNSEKKQSVADTQEVSTKE